MAKFWFVSWVLMLWNKSRPLRFLPACWAQRDIACRLWNPYKNQWLKKNKKKVLFIRPFFATWFLAVWCLKVVYFLAVQTGPLSGPWASPFTSLDLPDRSIAECSLPCRWGNFLQCWLNTALSLYICTLTVSLYLWPQLPPSSANIFLSTTFEIKVQDNVSVWFEATALQTSQ